ncbi:MAG: thiamine-phosphate kinase [Desulfobulbaceae bacterium]|nr:thiamine-phosphate kinase [Desulfobulbaceae bacterium]
MKERELIELINAMVGNRTPGVLCGIGDDCAVIEKTGDTAWLLTMDTLIEGSHFKVSHHPPFELGKKSVSVNVSDIAAMGGEPRFVLLSVGLPSDIAQSWSSRFIEGVIESCKEYGCLLIGGDTVRSELGISLTLTLIGEVKTTDVVYREGAVAGDHIWVSGPLGLSAAGLELCMRGLENELGEGVDSVLSAHLDPQARFILGPALANRRLVSAMMDISDGLATDLAHLCKRSSVGAVVEEKSLYRHPSLIHITDRLHLDPVRLMLSGGEDYELLFTALPKYKESILQLAKKYGLCVQHVGVIVEGSGVCLHTESFDGEGPGQLDISYQGFDHFAN